MTSIDTGQGAAAVPTAEPGLVADDIDILPDERVVRSPADLLRLVIAGATLLAVVLIRGLFSDAVSAFGVQFLRGLDALPDWLVTGLVAAEQVLAVVLLLGGLALVVIRRRWRLLLTAGGGAVAAAALLSLLWPLSGDVQTRLTPVTDAVAVLQRFPTAANLAAVTGLVTAASPWFTRRGRRAWWALVLLMAVVHALGTPVVFDTALAMLAGWFAGAAVVAAAGAPSRRPPRAAVVRGLAAVGLPLRRLDPASVDARGSTPYFGTTAAGTEVFVKVLGVDERSADTLFRLYRRIQPRDLGDERPFSSLRRTVEHEALVSLTASQFGVRTPRLAAFAAAEPNGFVLAYEAIAGRSLDRLTPDELTDDVVAAVWALVVRLRRHRIAHRDLRLANSFLADDGAVWLIDFGFSELAASDLLLATDVAELLASSCTSVGPDRAVSAGLAAVGPEGLASAVPRLRPAMLSGATRTALHQAPGTLDELRAQVTAHSAG
jgi:glycosyltransferase 2 family protein